MSTRVLISTIPGEMRVAHSRSRTVDLQSNVVTNVLVWVTFIWVVLLAFCLVCGSFVDIGLEKAGCCLRSRW